MNNPAATRKVFCKLCQILAGHPTSKCPTLVCIKCGQNGHAEKKCLLKKKKAITIGQSKNITCKQDCSTEKAEQPGIALKKFELIDPSPEAPEENSDIAVIGSVDKAHDFMTRVPLDGQFLNASHLKNSATITQDCSVQEIDQPVAIQKIELIDLSPETPGAESDLGISESAGKKDYFIEESRNNQEILKMQCIEKCVLRENTAKHEEQRLKRKAAEEANNANIDILQDITECIKIFSGKIEEESDRCLKIEVANEDVKPTEKSEQIRLKREAPDSNDESDAGEDKKRTKLDLANAKFVFLEAHFLANQIIQISAATVKRIRKWNIKSFFRPIVPWELAIDLKCLPPQLGIEFTSGEGFWVNTKINSKISCCSEKRAIEDTIDWLKLFKGMNIAIFCIDLKWMWPKLIFALQRYSLQGEFFSLINWIGDLKSTKYYEDICAELAGCQCAHESSIKVMNKLGAIEHVKNFHQSPEFQRFFSPAASLELNPSCNIDEVMHEASTFRVPIQAQLKLYFSWRFQETIDLRYKLIINEYVKHQKPFALEISDFVGNILPFTLDTIGSKFLCQKLTSSPLESDLEHVFSELQIWDTTALIFNPNAVNVILLLLEHGKHEQKSSLIENFIGKFDRVAITKNGSECICTAIKSCTKDAVKSYFLNPIKNFVNALLLDEHGCLILIHWIKFVSDESEFILEAVLANVLALISHQSATLVAMQLIEQLESNELIFEVVEKIEKMSSTLQALSVFGKLLDLNETRMVDGILAKVPYLIENLLGLKLIEKCLEVCIASNKERIKSSLKLHDCLKMKSSNEIDAPLC